MPSNLKKLVRARMAKTGESYQQALRHVRAQEAPLRDGPQAPPANLTPPSIIEWFPLGRDGVWLEEALWERNLRLLRSRRMGRRALVALQEVFTPGWSLEQTRVEAAWRDAAVAGGATAQELARKVHPILREQLTVGGRYRLLEVGVMLGHMSEKKALRERLRAAREYHGMCSELRAGLLLRAAGAEVEWEPIKGASGPDWKATWSGGVIGVEVKRPRISQRAEGLHQIEMALNFEFMAALSAPPLVVDSGIWLTLHPSAEVLTLKTVLGFADIEAVKRLARDAAEHVRRNLPSPTAEGRFSAGRGGEFTVHLGAGEQPQVQLGMYGLPGDDERDAKDLIDIVQEAAEQLRALGDMPGLVLLDADGDLGILRHLRTIHETLATEMWAKTLAGVALVTRTSSVVEELGESRIDAIVHVVPGPKIAALETTLLPRLRLCDRKHFHSDPLLDPPPRCHLTW